MITTRILPVVKARNHQRIIMKHKVEKANAGASVKSHNGFYGGGGYQGIKSTSRLSKEQDREQKMRKMGLSTGAMVERKEKTKAKKDAAMKSEAMKKGAQKGSVAKTVQSEKKKDEIKAAYGKHTMGKKKKAYGNKGLYANINARKKAGTSRSKKDSTISDEAYANMKAGFPKKKKKKTA